MDFARPHELAGYKTCARGAQLQLYTDDFAFVNWATLWLYQEKDYDFYLGLFIAIRRLAPVTMRLLHEQLDDELHWLSLCKLRLDRAALFDTKSQLDLVSRGCAKIMRTFLCL